MSRPLYRGCALFGGSVIRGFTVLQATNAIAGRSPWNDDEVSIICVPHQLNMVLECWQGLRTRLEYYTSLKKAVFGSLDVDAGIFS